MTEGRGGGRCSGGACSGSNAALMVMMILLCGLRRRWRLRALEGLLSHYWG